MSAVNYQQKVAFDVSKFQKVSVILSPLLKLYMASQKGGVATYSIALNNPNDYLKKRKTSTKNKYFYI